MAPAKPSDSDSKKFKRELLNDLKRAARVEARHPALYVLAKPRRRRPLFRWSLDYRGRCRRPRSASPLSQLVTWPASAGAMLFERSVFAISLLLCC